MKRQIIAVSVFLLLFQAIGYCTLNTQIVYETEQLSPDRWKYTYDVQNVGLSNPIEEFTIWFDFGSYDNLAVETSEPLASDWDEIVWQPEPFLNDDGAYDAKALNVGIQQGNIVRGFAVSFDWLGEAEPGSQFYEIVDPETFKTIDSGWTVPEPGTLCLLAFGGLVLLRKQT